MSVLAGCTLSLAGCATNSAKPRQAVNIEHLTEQTLSTPHYQHRIYSNRLRDGHRLHIYLEGDGTPWLAGARISPDPTPRNPLALRLMSLDHNPAIYVARPCHFVARQDPNCHPDSWTFGRYSEAVVASMSRAIERAAALHGAAEWVLIGYSGGGALAVLIAERLPRVAGVVTIAANLDIDKWTELRGFEPLAASLNPNLRPPLPPRIRQLHLVGARDQIVPPAVTSAYTQRHAQSEWTFADYGHACCWERDWPAILARISTHWRSFEPVH